MNDELGNEFRVPRSSFTCGELAGEPGGAVDQYGGVVLPPGTMRKREGVATREPPRRYRPPLPPPDFLPPAGLVPPFPFGPLFPLSGTVDLLVLVLAAYRHRQVARQDTRPRCTQRRASPAASSGGPVPLGGMTPSVTRRGLRW